MKKISTQWWDWMNKFAFMIKACSCVCEYGIEEAVTWEEKNGSLYFIYAISMPCTHTNALVLIINWASRNCITSTTTNTPWSVDELVSYQHNAETIKQKHKKYYRKLFQAACSTIDLFYTLLFLVVAAYHTKTN